MKTSKSIVVVGGGMSGLACSLVLKNLSAIRGKRFNVTLLESASRLGGQINTERFRLDGHDGDVIVEGGAEGFVARSTVFPRLAEFTGLKPGEILGQKRIADCELIWSQSLGRWDVAELAAGVAAKKLGFQVPKEHQGKGIRTFKSGMSQIIESIESQSQFQINTTVTGIEKLEKGFAITTSSRGSIKVLEADAVVLATPAKVINYLLKPLDAGLVCDDPPHHSHVSVHLLLKNGSLARAPSSFTVPSELQAKFGGLRACSFVNEKFSGRCDDNHILFRLYFRPDDIESVTDRDAWVRTAFEALDEVFGIKSPVSWSHFSPWVSALPSFSEKYLENCRELKDNINSSFGVGIQVIGAEVTGAGLEVAASSGYDAAIKLVDLL